jgi:hypothetical protein
MKTKSAFISLALVFLFAVTFSQDLQKSTDSAVRKNQIGIQYNPLFDLKWVNTGNLYSIRYGYKVSRPLTIGAEITTMFPNGNYPEIPNIDPDFSIKDRFGLSTNLFFRYSVRTDKRIQGFLEVSPYAHFYMEKPLQYHDMDFFVYIAPGLSVFSKNRKFSMDLYYKYSTQTFTNTRHGVLSYKLNFHF